MSNGSEFSLTTFSPKGNLVQIDYALNAVAKSQVSLGIKAKNGVVIASEKKIPSPLVDESSMNKIQLLTRNIGTSYAGLVPDFRVLTRRGQKEGQKYYLQYKEDMPVSQLVREVASVMQEFTQSGGVRPFGVSLLIAGYDDDGPQLYQVGSASARAHSLTNGSSFLFCCCVVLV